ncbi:MAG TPA: transglycosylase SLT domain-containing protein [Blastocatellia bacterium]|nr:transglycosylase SLT domain-containing protein [Blastocatellia bacterium]
MKSLPSLPELHCHPVRLVLHLVLSLLIVQTFYFSSLKVGLAQTKASTQLRAAVASNSEPELQRVESSFPGTEEAALARLLRGYLRQQAKDYSSAANILNDPSIARLTGLGDYALYYRGQALLENGRSEEAERQFRNLAQSYPTSLLARSAILQAAGASMMRGQYQAVIDDLMPLIEKNDGTALKLRADALEKLGRNSEAVVTLRRLYFDAPQSAEAEKASARLVALGSSSGATDVSQLKRRADKLYQAGLYADAALAYDQMARQFPGAGSDESWLSAGTSYYKANSFRQAAESLSRVRSDVPNLKTEALYYFALANLSMNNEPAAQQAQTELRRFTTGNSRNGDLIYAFGRYHEKRGRDAQARTYYTQMIAQYPESENADEAHFWLAWRAHEAKDYATAGRMLTEHVANYGGVTENRGRAGFWAAVDSERSGNKSGALTLYRALLMRYGAGWFGVNAERRINKLVAEGVEMKPISSDQTLRNAVEGLQSIKLPQETLKDSDRERVTKAEQLIKIALHQSAMNELDAARAGAPNSPIVNLRVAQVFRANGENFPAINALKRAYPDYGQTLPEEMPREAWEVFYPLKYWANIKEEARRNGLDPYMVAGLIRQETVFDAKARSRANAYGLMQLLPSTGQAVARKNSLNGGRISSSDLFNPVLNIQLGTAFVKELMDRFGRFEYVAAGYNGGPTRVSRWLKELPTAEIEEWVESIPLSETRLYVQGVYRNARQYQRLYDDQGRFRSTIPEK